LIRAKVTSKGQITLPSRVRERLGIEYGDEVVFDLTDEGIARMTVLKRPSLSSLYGALRVHEDYPGSDEIRRRIKYRLAGESADEGESG